MSRLNLTIKTFFFLFLTLLFSACDSDSQNGEVLESTFINVKDANSYPFSNNLTFEAEANNYRVWLTTNKTWRVSVNSGNDWCTTTTSGGNAGDIRFDIQIAENITYTSRKASVSIVAGEGNDIVRKVVNITQNGAIEPTPEPEPEPEPTPDEEMAACDANAPVGFASKVTGGEGGKSVVVTSATELQNALKQTEAMIIYIKGEITTDNVISVLATNKTILGLPKSALTNPNRTQNQSGILYFKEGSNNLILRNLTFKSAGAYDVDGRDNLCLDGSTNVWVDHCDFQDGVDGNFDCKNASDNIAATWCRFRYLIQPQAGGSGGSNDHRFSCLWGSSDNHTQDRGHLNTTFQYCWWDEGCKERMPRVRFGQVHIVNCLYSTKTTSACIGVGKEANIYVDRCIFTGPKKAYKTHNDDGQIRFDDCLFTNGTSSTNGTGNSFTPTYELPTSLDADKVENIVSTYAGATLTINEP